MKPAPIRVEPDMGAGTWLRYVRAGGRWYLVGEYPSRTAALAGGPVGYPAGWAETGS